MDTDALSYQEMFDENLAVMLLINPDDGEILDANKGACQFYGYPYSYITSMSISDISVQNQSEVEEQPNQPDKKNSNYSYCRHRLASGEVRKVKVCSIPTSIENKHLRYLVIHNISDRDFKIKHTEMLMHLAECSDQGIGWADLDGTVRYMNPALKKMLAVPDQATLSDYTFNDFYSDTGQKYLHEKILPIVMQKGHWIGESELTSLNGSRVPTIHNLVLIRDSDDNAIAIAIANMLTDITEKNKIEKVFRDQARIIDQIHDAVVSTDLEGIITGWNLGAEKQLGYASEEMLGKHISVLYPNEEHGYLKNNIIAPLQSKGVHEVETTVLRKSGEHFNAHLSLSMIYDEQNNPAGMIGYAVDITDRILAETALRKSETHLRTLIEILPDLVWLKDPEGVFLTCNNRVESFLGVKKAEIIGKTDYDFVDKELADFFREKDKAALAAGVPSTNVEMLSFANDGHTEQVETIKTPMLDPNGEIIGVLGVARDITKHKELETALQEGFETYQAAINTSLMGFWAIDLNGRFLETNQAYLKMSGFSREEFLNMTIPDLEAAMSPEKVQEKIQLVMAEGFARFRTRHRRKDGTTWPVEVAASFSEIQGGRFFVFLEDLTEKDAAEQKLAHYRNHLEELVAERTSELEDARNEAVKANRAKSDFLSSMSHELRTPLNAILGFGQLMEFSDDLSDINKENLQEILNAGHHLLELIKEVLDLSKIETGNLNLSIEPTELYPVVKECLTLLKTLAERRRISIICNGLVGAVVRADRIRLKQALLNLLSNAIKYNREGGSITVEAHVAQDQQLDISVSDSGNGIPSNRLNELFQPFKRLGAESSGIEGTGIGLALTQKIVELMDGSVSVQSEIDVGSTFTITLPVDSIPEYTRKLDQKSDVGDSQVEEIPTARNTVLYIEDNPANLKLIEQIFALRDDAQLITAHTASLGIELAVENEPKLILLDINLPGMNGYQILDVFKGIDKLKHSKVISITANAMNTDIERGKAAGFAEYLTKPLDIANFNKVLDKYLEV